MLPKNDTVPHTRGVLSMLASVLLFSVSILTIRAVSLHTPAVDGWLASLFRGAIGLLVVFILHGRGRGLRTDRLFSNRLIVLRGVVGALAICVFYVTIVKLGAARAVVLNLTYPLFGSIIAALWLKEKITRKAMLWMAASLGGLVVFLSGHGKLTQPSAYDLLALIGAVAAGWVVVIIRRLRHEEHPATIYAAQAFFSLLVATPAAVALPALPASAWLGLTAAAILVAFAQLIMTRAFQTLTVARGSSIQMLLPVFTAIGGFFCFGETFQPLEFLGAGITLVATWRVMVSR